MEADPKPSIPDVQEFAPPPYPTQPGLPTYAQAVYPSGYPQPYYPQQVAPPVQPMVYQQAPYVVTSTTAPPFVATGLQPHYSDYMCWSVISMLFCCFPVGLAALIFSCKTQDAIARQDSSSARTYSSSARGFNITAMMFGTVIYLFIFSVMMIRRHSGF